MYKVTLSKEYNGKAVQHFSQSKAIIDSWVKLLLDQYPDETIKVYKEENELIEMHKGSEVKD